MFLRIILKENTYRRAISSRTTLLPGKSWGSSSTNFTRATSRSGLTTVSFGSLLATWSRRSGRSRIAL